MSADGWTKVLAAALAHEPTTVPALALACCNGECSHDGYEDCPEIDLAVCAACYGLVVDYIDGTSYPTEILAGCCPICVAVVAWRTP